MKIFQKISFEEAHREVLQRREKIKRLEEQGACYGGRRKIDREYKQITCETLAYAQQFDRIELLVLTGQWQGALWGKNGWQEESKKLNSRGG